MKLWSVNVVINYEIEAETREDAIERAKTEFSEDDDPSYEIRVDYSWEENDGEKCY